VTDSCPSWPAASIAFWGAKGRHIFRDFIAAVGLITLSDREIMVQDQKRAHHPLLIAAGFGKTEVAGPWLGDKRLRLVFG